jgi:flavin reductase (DIM6/NTAB) family NADH-FMN oxidoreductase RutF
MEVTVEQVFNVATHIVAIASVVAAVTPTPADNAVLIVARKVLDLFAFNVLGAKNQAQVEAEKFKK